MKAGTEAVGLPASPNVESSLQLLNTGFEGIVECLRCTKQKDENSNWLGKVGTLGQLAN